VLWLNFCGRGSACADNRFWFGLFVALPLVAYVFATITAAMALRSRGSLVLLLAGLALAAVSGFFAVVGLGLVLLMAAVGVFEYAIPVLLYGSLSVIALIPASAILNLAVLFRSIKSRADRTTA
jgi:fatty acid desaturase